MEEETYIETVQAYRDMVYRLALHDCRNRQDAEDVMQIVFLKLLKNNPVFESEEHRRSWLVRVTVNECRRLFVSPWRKVQLTDQMPGEKEKAWEPREDSLILEAVMKLPRKYRIPVYLYYYEDYSVAEMSRLLDRKVSTLQSQLMRARKLLRKLLEEAGYDG